MFFGVKSPDGTEIFPLAPAGWESRWICGKDTYQELVNENMIVWKKVAKNGEEKWQVYQKHYLGAGVKYASNLWCMSSNEFELFRSKNKRVFS